MRISLKNYSLKSKLIFIMIFLLFLSILSLFLMNSRSERIVMSEIQRHTEDLASAIQISVDQLTSEEDISDRLLQEYIKGKDKKGIREISIISNVEEVIASSNPKKVGEKINDNKKKNILITAKLGEDLGADAMQKTYNLILPVVVGNENLGYVQIIMFMDDFTKLLKSNYLRRLIVTILVFGIGIFATFYLSQRYTKPIKMVVEATKKVARGDLSQSLNIDRRDEIGELMRNFNEMVAKLRMNRELEERLKKTEHMAILGQLASGIAHEIRNPLNFINLSIDHLRNKFAPEDSVKKDAYAKLISGIKDEIHRLNGMVINFLNYGKPLKLNLKWHRIDTLIDEVIQLVREKVNEQDIEIQVNHIDTNVELTFDLEMLKTCFINVVLNSIQAMPYGGKISITTERNTSEKLFKVIFNDTGTGIDEKNMEKIFEPYFTTKDVGIGLGLSITKRIVEEHGGNINIKSRLDIGTTVTISLPLKEIKI